MTAIRMAVEDFGGKVLGKPIEVVVADHQNKPDTASALARKWFDMDHVDMIGNLINSSIALTVSGLAKEKNRIAIINGSGSSRSDRGRVHAEQRPLRVRYVRPRRAAPALHWPRTARGRGTS